jgi:hypothetical protein
MPLPNIQRFSRLPPLREEVLLRKKRFRQGFPIFGLGVENTRQTLILDSTQA